MIPVSVIGGFLGAGKTTLVNHLLRNAGRRWGILVNDFGALNVDAALIASTDAQTMALTNGCVCCSIGDDFGASLNRLAQSRPDHIVVEASGVADPWRIAQLALVEPGFSLEPITVLADATALAAGLADRWTADTLQRQLASAELIVLNKCDIATPVQMGAARDAITALRGNVPLVQTANAVVPEHAWKFPTGLRARPTRLHAEAPHPFVSGLWRPPRPLDMVSLRVLLSDLPASVLRIKGLIPVADGHALLQFAAGRWAVSPPPADLEPGLVIIGTPDMPDVAARLQSCLQPG